MSTKLNVFYNPKTKCVSREPYPEDDTCFYGIGHMLFAAMQNYQKNIAQIDALTNECITYKMLLLKCIRCALRMRDLGVVKGDVISISSNNHLNTIVPLVATQFLGVILAPVDRRLSYDDNKYIINLIQPKLIFIISDVEETIVRIIDELKLTTIVISFSKSCDYNTHSFEDFLDEHPDEVNFQPHICNDLKEPTFIIFSSGTTDRPKGIYQTHNHYKINTDADNYANISVGLYYSEIFWTVSLQLRTSFIRNGITDVVVDYLDTENLWKYVEKFKIEYVLHIATKVGQITEVKPDKTSLKIFEITGDCVHAKDMENLAQKLPNVSILNTYGITQIGFISGFNRNECIPGKLHSCGYPTSGTTIKIVDPNSGKALSFNKKGDVYVKTNCDFTYFQHLYDSKKEYDNEGFFNTGDLGYYNEDCCLYIEGRECDSFKCLLWKITPSMIENIIKLHSEVVEAAVVGVPDQFLDHKALGLVVLNPCSSLTEEELLQYVNSRVEYYHELKGGIKFVKELPTTSVGKLKRRKLLNMVLKNQL